MSKNKAKKHQSSTTPEVLVGGKSLKEAQAELRLQVAVMSSAIIGTYGRAIADTGHTAPIGPHACGDLCQLLNVALSIPTN